jgi:hypothetical protein
VAGVRLAKSAASIAALAALAVAGTGCGEDTLKQEGAVDLVNKQLDEEGVKAESVECPDDVEAKQGTSFDCKVTLTTGETGTYTIKIQKVEGDTASLQIVDFKRGSSATN